MTTCSCRRVWTRTRLSYTTHTPSENTHTHTQGCRRGRAVEMMDGAVVWCWRHDRCSRFQSSSCSVCVCARLAQLRMEREKAEARGRDLEDQLAELQDELRRDSTKMVPTDSHPHTHTHAHTHTPTPTHTHSHHLPVCAAAGGVPGGAGGGV